MPTTWWVDRLRGPGPCPAGDRPRRLQPEGARGADRAVSLDHLPIRRVPGVRGCQNGVWRRRHMESTRATWP